MFVIRYIYAHPGANKSMITCSGGTRASSKIRSLDKLVKIGLVDPEPGVGNEILYYLTADGERIAKHLNEISDISRSTAATSSRTGRSTSTLKPSRSSESTTGRRIRTRTLAATMRTETAEQLLRCLLENSAVDRGRMFIPCPTASTSRCAARPGHRGF